MVPISQSFQLKGPRSLHHDSLQHLGTFVLSDTTLEYSYMTSDGRELMRDQEKGMLASSLSFPMQSFFLEFRLLLFFVFFIIIIFVTLKA